MLHQALSRTLRCLAVAVYALALVFTSGASAQEKTIKPGNATFSMEVDIIEVCWVRYRCVNFVSPRGDRRNLCTKQEIHDALVDNTTWEARYRVGEDPISFSKANDEIMNRTTNTDIYAAFFDCRTGLGFWHGVLCIDFESAAESDHLAYEVCLYTTEDKSR